MPLSLKRVLAGAGLAAVLAAVPLPGTGLAAGRPAMPAVAQSASGTGAPQRSPAGEHGHGHGHGHGHHHGVVTGLLGVAAGYLGLTPAQLHGQLAGGRTLAQIAQQRGKSVPGLRQAVLREFKTHLDGAVARGRLTPAEAEAKLGLAEQHVDGLLNRPWSTQPPTGPQTAAPAR